MIGVVITTSDGNYVIAIQCLMWFLRHLIAPYYIILYINDVRDDRFRNMQKEFSFIDIVLLEKSHSKDSAWIWNDCMARCIAKKCTSIILSNDSILFDDRIKHILTESEMCKILAYFGPVSYNLATDSQKTIISIQKNPFEYIAKKTRVNLNREFMVLSVMSLLANMYDSDHFFDLAKLHGENKVESYRRFHKSEDKTIVVSKTFTSHLKNCIFAINQGEDFADEDKIDIRNYLNFIDHYKMMYTCLQNDILPLLIKPSEYGQTSKSMLSFNHTQYLYKQTSDVFRYGIIITVTTNEYVFVKQLILCFYRYIKNPYILLFMDDIIDTRLKDINLEFTDVVIRQKSLDKIMMWNKAVNECLKENCQTIIFANDNIIFSESINHILTQSLISDISCYGPISNVSHNKHQLESITTTENIFITEALDDFFLVIPKISLLANRLSDGSFFQTDDLDWFKRFTGKIVVVSQSYVYRYKKPTSKECLYTVNTGGYEKDRILINGLDHKIDCLYFTDNETLIGKCISLNLIPFIVKPQDYKRDAKKTQRTIKTSPHVFLPSYYDTSLYIDSHLILNREAKSIIDDIKDYDLICYHHPRKPYPANVASEFPALSKLVQKDQLDDMINYMKSNGFIPEIHYVSDTCILTRRHKNIIPFSEEWTRLVNIVHRDQVTFDYLLWKYDLKYRRDENKNIPITKMPHVNPRTRLLDSYQKSSPCKSKRFTSRRSRRRNHKRASK